MRKSLLLAAAAILGISGLASAKQVGPAAAVSQLTDGGTYYIYDSHNISDKRHAMLHVVESDGKYVATYNAAITPESAVTEAPAIDYVWVAVADGTNWKFKNLSTGRYIMGSDNAEMSDDVAAAQSLTLKEYGASNIFQVQKPNGQGFDKNAGNTGLLYWAGGHPIEFYEAVPNDDATAYTIKTATNTDVNVTFVTAEGAPISVASLTGPVGETYTITLPAFYATDDELTGTYGEDDVDLDITVYESYPFVVSESLDDLKWQTVQQHATYCQNNGKSGHAWMYEGADADVRVHHMNFVASEEAVADEYLWAFVGNRTDGFKIYNKKAGTDKTLWRQDANSICRVGTPAEGASDVWYVFASRTNIDTQTFCCFNQNDGQYINVQNWDGDTFGNGYNQNVREYGKLNKWGDADQGSTCWFSTRPADPVIEYLEGAFTYPTDIVGGYTAEDAAALKADFDAVKENRFDAEAALALIPSFKEKQIAFDTNKYYRLRNFQYSTYLYEDNIYDDTIGEMWGDITDATDNLFSIVKFEPVEGSENEYNINLADKYFHEVTSYSQPLTLVEKELAGKYSVNKADNMPAFYIKGTNHLDDGYNAYHCLHVGNYQGEPSNVVTWEPGANATWWYLVPANDFTVATDDNGIAMGYFPFPVKAKYPEDDLLNYVVEKESLVDAPNYMTLVPGAVVPAYTPVIITSSDTNVTLLIADEAEADTEVTNVLEGTLRAKQINSPDYYLGTKDNVVGFYAAPEAPAPVETPETPEEGNENENEPAAQADEAEGEGETPAEPAAPTAYKVATNGIYLPAANTAAQAEWYAIKDAEIGVTGLTISEEAVTIVEGETATLTATLEPADAINGEEIVWTSSNEAVATVTNGIVTAVAEGTATITAAANGFTAECTVTVTAKPEEPIESGLQTITAGSVAKAYDLQGRKVTKASKGLYIINGQKTLVK